MIDATGASRKEGVGAEKGPEGYAKKEKGEKGENDARNSKNKVHVRICRSLVGCGPGVHARAEIPIVTPTRRPTADETP